MKVKIGKVYKLDLGSLSPVLVKVLEIKSDFIVCKYLKYENRIENLEHELFRMNGYKI